MQSEVIFTIISAQCHRERRRASAESIPNRPRIWMAPRDHREGGQCTVPDGAGDPFGRGRRVVPAESIDGVSDRRGRQTSDGEGGDGGWPQPRPELGRCAVKGIICLTINIKVCASNSRKFQIFLYCDWHCFLCYSLLITRVRSLLPAVFDPRRCAAGNQQAAPTAEEGTPRRPPVPDAPHGQVAHGDRRSGAEGGIPDGDGDGAADAGDAVPGAGGAQASRDLHLGLETCILIFCHCSLVRL